MAGKHGAEGGKGEEKQSGAALNQQPDSQGGQRLSPALHRQKGQFGGRRHQSHRQMGQQQAGQTGQILGGEQGLPPQGQRVHHGGGPVIV